jgi:hypothetical protein
MREHSDNKQKGSCVMLSVSREELGQEYKRFGGE